MKKLQLLLIAGIILFSSCSVIKPKQEKETKVLIETSLGSISIKLYNETPLHRDNFIKLVNEGFYNQVLFHRVIKGFMVQAGDPDSKGAGQEVRLGSGGPGYRIPAEIVYGKFHKKGALSAARTGDRSNPSRMSSGSQFYIVQGKPLANTDIKNVEQRSGWTYTEEQKETYKTLGGAPHLDGQYSVFGEVTQGLEIVDKIAASETLQGDRPKEDIKIISMKIVK